MCFQPHTAVLNHRTFRLMQQQKQRRMQRHQILLAGDPQYTNTEEEKQNIPTLRPPATTARPDGLPDISPDLSEPPVRGCPECYYILLCPLSTMYRITLTRQLKVSHSAPILRTSTTKSFSNSHKQKCSPEEQYNLGKPAACVANSLFQGTSAGTRTNYNGKALV